MLGLRLLWKPVLFRREHGIEKVRRRTARHLRVALNLLADLLGVVAEERRERKQGAGISLIITVLLEQVQSQILR